MYLLLVQLRVPPGRGARRCHGCSGQFRHERGRRRRPRAAHCGGRLRGVGPRGEGGGQEGEQGADGGGDPDGAAGCVDRLAEQHAAYGVA
eukprot:scaffold126284_cov57-Phaeocystis_antarctica.AAC.1